MKVTFGNFINQLKTKLEFEVEWDVNKWNDAYWDFKNWCKGVDPQWAAFQDAKSLFSIFADEFYQDAKPDTHNYWLKKGGEG